QDVGLETKFYQPDLSAATTFFFAVTSSSRPRTRKAAQPTSEYRQARRRKNLFAMLSERGSAKRPWGSETTGRRS
ncbi:MAG TPA: hypothetical protein VN831_17180, partial [Bradyrhizobium sp.]|nr:hypothetical protein [Bradyrhizobium sp.]